MKRMGLMHYILGLEVWQGDGDFFILQRFHMDNCKPVETPLETNSRKEDATSGEEVHATIY